MENNQINVRDLSIEQLESLGYRLVKQLNSVQRDLNVVERELDKRQTAHQTELPIENKGDEVTVHTDSEDTE